ncbi:AarF/ABC1/UbiB kinase family protein [Methanoculleus sp. FWC-SCC1]|uniref:AarF/ABC1/UbiB kinase family protein n=1 Tax=Methanoculleus frigidifontis TaxID=2584085 RepID=A0ABT8MCK3_9EURY|nr:AarF/ABC1/UbiB kinase family protein [Methanoculleus sp. FWC-SCC1]MDN7025634.1 AarF/ABC1/UbiB kinase family protein [Methanoculleus sp. FWC-SCC1]
MVTRFQRYGQIADVLIKYGFGILVEEVFPGSERLRAFKKRQKVEERSVYERIRLAIEELGPTFIKFGQITSTRRELLPPELIEELQKLQDQVAPLPYSDVLPVIREYCPNFGECFDLIEEEPCAAASLSQVHRAVLKDGSVVALKVQRPGIVDLIEIDLLILRSLADRVEMMYPDLRVYNPSGIVDEFALQIRRELDFVQDGKNAERLGRNMRDVHGVRVPKIYWNYSGTRMLTMEYVEGVRIDDVDALRKMGLLPGELAERGFYAYIKQIFIDGFFHGDPHPGNLLVTDRGSIVFLDFGIVGLLRPEKKRRFIDLLLAIVETDVDRVIDAFKHLGVSIKPEDLENVKDEIYLVLVDYRDMQIQQFDFGMALMGLTDTLRRYRIRVPPTLMLMLKVIVMVMDVGTALDPTFNFDRKIRPYITEIVVQERFSPKRVLGAGHAIAEAVDSLVALPRSIADTLQNVSEGSITLEVEKSNLAQIVDTLDHVTDKVLIGLIVAAIVVGSSLILRVSDVVLPDYITWLAIMGYAVAVVVGFYAIYHAIGYRSDGGR